MPKILVFDKGGRKDREKLVRNKEAPSDFFQSIDYLRSKGFDLLHLSSSGNYKKYDAVLAMYHDQGLIPFKMLSKNQGVNFTAGLPFIRTSPDHGTAYDIAGKNLSSPHSFKNAIELAKQIFIKRSE